MYKCYLCGAEKHPLITRQEKTHELIPAGWASITLRFPSEPETHFVLCEFCSSNFKSLLQFAKRHKGFGIKKSQSQQGEPDGNA